MFLTTNPSYQAFTQIVAVTDYTITFSYDSTDTLDVVTYNASTRNFDNVDSSYYSITGNTYSITTTPALHPDNWYVVRRSALQQSFGSPKFATYNQGSAITASNLNGDFELLRRSIESLDNFNDLVLDLANLSFMPKDSTTESLTCVNITTTNNVTVGNDLSVTDDATIGGDLSVTGTATLGTININNITSTSNVTVGGDLSVTGSSTLAGVTATGVIATSVTTSGPIVVGGSTACNSINASGSVTIASGGSLTCNGGSTFNQTASFAGITASNEIEANAGIVFSGSANTYNRTLDDYEFGTWTPTLPNHPDATFPTSAIMVGEFERVGPLVTIHFRINFSQVMSSANDLVIGGLPFTSVTGTNVTKRVGTVVPVLGFNTSPTVGGFSLILDGQNLKINVGATGTGDNTDFVTHDQTTGSGTEFIGSISYYCAALT